MDPVLYNKYVNIEPEDARTRFGKSFCLQRKKDQKDFDNFRDLYSQAIKIAEVYTVSDSVARHIDEMVVKFLDDRDYRTKILGLARVPNKVIWVEWSTRLKLLKPEKELVRTAMLLANSNISEKFKGVITEVSSEGKNITREGEMFMGYIRTDLNSAVKEGITNDTISFDILNDYVFRCAQVEDYFYIDSPIISMLQSHWLKSRLHKDKTLSAGEYKRIAEAANNIAQFNSSFICCLFAFMASVPYTTQKIKKDFVKEYHPVLLNHPVDITTIVDINVPGKRYTPGEFIDRSLNKGLEKIKKRLHGVRGHWRYYRRPDGTVYHQVWIKEHERGDERLGRVTHSYYDIRDI